MDSHRPSLTNTVRDAILHLFFPHLCAGCGHSPGTTGVRLCGVCLLQLPETGFIQVPGNPMEKKFWGRIKVESAAAIFYFTAGTLIQHLMHRLKYQGDRDVGLQLGQLMGTALAETRFHADLLIPLPLFAARQHKRGYNQAEVLCQGISKILGLPIAERAVCRTRDTGTQTSMSRTERWTNMDGRFMVTESRHVEGKHVLLVDDVMTTGATLEACGQELLRVSNVRLSIATLCYAAQV